MGHAVRREDVYSLVLEISDSISFPNWRNIEVRSDVSSLVTKESRFRLDRGCFQKSWSDEDLILVMLSAKSFQVLKNYS